MKVLKFGGTSVGTVDSLRNVRSIVEANAEPVVVVVSALGGLTDQLIAAARLAETGSRDYVQAADGFRKRHHEIIDTLVPLQCRGAVSAQVDALLDELNDLFTGVSLIQELPPRTLDRIVSFGERMSSVIVAAVIDGAAHQDSLRCIITERWKDRDIADRSSIDRLVREMFPLPLKCHQVMGGFISRDRDSGKITNLGRGGSDFTAALVAAALDADSLEIWTDVDGFMTSDPRIIPNARVIPRMSFVESMELCSFGAKVVYPPTIYPVFHKNIPIRILNSHNPAAPGTLITDMTSGLPDCVRGVSALRDTDMITLTGRLAANVTEINTRCYNAMARAGINVILISVQDSGAGFSISLSASDSARAMDVLNTEFAPEIGNGDIRNINLRNHLAVLAVVREGILRDPDVPSRICEALDKGGVPVLGVSEGRSDATVAMLVDDALAPKALGLVHNAVITN